LQCIPFVLKKKKKKKKIKPWPIVFIKTKIPLQIRKKQKSGSGGSSSKFLDRPRMKSKCFYWLAEGLKLNRLKTGTQLEEWCKQKVKPWLITLQIFSSFEST